MANIEKRPREDGKLTRHGNARAPTVSPRVKAAAELLAASLNPDYQVIAKAVGFLNARGLRRALELPQSLKYLREFKKQRLVETNLANVEALRQVRDTAENAMARVAAARGLEAMEERLDQQTGGRAGDMAPGVTIVIESAVGATMRTIGPTTIEGEAEEV